MMEVHTFATSAEAYDASQTDDAIHHLDLLMVPEEGVGGYLFEAWPIAVTATIGSFHEAADGFYDQHPEAIPARDAAHDLIVSLMKVGMWGPPDPVPPPYWAVVREYLDQAEADGDPFPPTLEAFITDLRLWEASHNFWEREKPDTY